MPLRNPNFRFQLKGSEMGGALSLANGISTGTEDISTTVNQSKIK